MAFEDIDQRMIKAFAVRQHRGHELGWKITLEPRGLIRLDAVSGAVRFAKRVSGKAGNQFPHFNNLLRRVAARPRRREKLAADFLDNSALLFVERAAQYVGAARRQTGEGFAELQDMLLVNDQSVSAPQARFQ